MFSDDSSIMGCVHIGDESDYRGLVENFVFWCKVNNLQFNTGETKEPVVHFWHVKETVRPVTIQRVEVEMVQSDRYLGIYLNCRLNWTDNTNAPLQEMHIYRKCQSRLFFPQRLRSFNVCSRLLGSVNCDQHSFLWCGLPNTSRTWSGKPTQPQDWLWTHCK